jgi:type II secretory pathway component PulF
MAVVVVIILLTFLLPENPGHAGPAGRRSAPDHPDPHRRIRGFTITYGPFVLVAVIALVLGCANGAASPSGKRRTDYWLLRSPFIGRIYIYSNIYGTTNLMSTLLGSGVNTTETLRLVERTINNVILRGKFALARKQIQEGVSMANAIQRVHYMPDMAMDILTVGETPAISSTASTTSTRSTARN